MSAGGNAKSKSGIPGHNGAGYGGLRLLGAVMATLVLLLSGLMGWRTWTHIAEDREVTLRSELANGSVVVRALEEHARQTVDDAIRTLDQFAAAVAGDADAARGDRARLRALIAESTPGQSRHLKALQFVARDGMSWISSPDYPAHRVDVSDRQHIRFLLDNPTHVALVVGHPYPSRYDSQLALPLARNVYDSDGRHIGIVSVDIRLSYFSELYARVAKDNQACVALISEQGFVIVRTPFEARYSDRDIAAEPALATLKGRTGEGFFFDEAFLDDELPRYYVYRKTEHLPMVVLYGRDKDSIFAAWDERRRTRLNFGFAAAAMLLTLVVLITLFVRRLRLARDALQDTQEKFFGLFEHSPLPMILIRYPDNVIMEVNQAWSGQLGYDRREVLGRDTTTVNIWVDLEERKTLIRQLLRDTSLPAHDVQLRHRDGRILTFELAASEFETGRERLFVFTLHDVTRERAAEQEIRDLNAQLEARVASRTQKLEAANKELTRALESVKAMQTELIRAEKLAALGSLVAGVAHELNTPIGNSLTVATTIAEHTAHFDENRKGGQLTRRQLDDYAATVAEGASILTRTLTRAAELVSSFKQVAVDQTADVRRKFPLHSVLQEMAITLDPVLRKTPYRLQLEQIDDVELDSYPGALGQVINNFVNNALLHAFEGRSQGTMTLEGRRLDEHTVQIVFADDGVGIPAENLAKVFDPFFTTKLGAGGSGLGMHIVYNIVTELLGGSIDVGNRVDGGLRIDVRIPIVAPVRD